MKNRRLTYWTILLNPVFIVACALGLHFLYQLCQYGGLRRNAPWVLGCALAGLVWILLWTVLYFLRKKRFSETETAEQSLPWKKGLLVVLVVEILALVIVGGFYGTKIAESAVPYNGKLSWKIQEWRSSRKIKLEQDNVYESGVSGIFEDLGEKIDLPEELYIINPFSLTYDGDGEIQKFYGFFWGKDEGGEEHTYLLDYDRAKDRRMTVWLDGEGDRREYPGKRFMPFLELMDGARLRSITGALAENDMTFQIRYAGYESITDPASTLVFNANGEVTGEGLEQRKEAYLAQLTACRGEELVGEIWLVNGWRYADTTQEKKEKEEAAREELKEIGSCYMDRADENWYFYLNEEEGWRLRVLDAAAGSRYYVMDHTKDGGASFQEINQAPFGDQIGVTRGILFFDEQYGYISLGNASGETAELYVTRDGGVSFQQIDLPWEQVTDIPDDVAGYGYLFLPEETGTGLQVTAAKDSSGQSRHLIFVSEDQGKTWSYKGSGERQD